MTTPGSHRVRHPVSVWRQRRFWISPRAQAFNPTSFSFSAIRLLRTRRRLPPTRSQLGALVAARTGCLSPLLPVPSIRAGKLAAHAVLFPFIPPTPSFSYAASVISLRASELTWVRSTSRCFETGRAPVHRKVNQFATRCTPSFNIIFARCVSTSAP